MSFLDLYNSMYCLYETSRKTPDQHTVIKIKQYYKQFPNTKNNIIQYSTQMLYCNISGLYILKTMI